MEQKTLRKLRLPRKLKKKLKLTMQYYFGGKKEILTKRQIAHYFELKTLLYNKYWKEIREFKKPEYGTKN